MPRTHKPYDAAFRQQAVELALTSGNPYGEVARDLGVSVDTLRTWRQQHERLPDKEPVAVPVTPRDLERENQRLRRELAYTQRQRKILKKPWPSVRRSPSCWTIRADRAEGPVHRRVHPTALLNLGRVPGRLLCPPPQGDPAAPGAGSRAHRKDGAPLPPKPSHTYGSPRLQAALSRASERCGNRVARLMRQQGLRAKQKRRVRPLTTQSQHRLPVAENWLAQVPAPARPNQIWVGDITYLPTREGRLYLAIVLDACSRKIVGWQTGDSLESSLVTEALQQAW